jgi:hypothetical protein
MELKDINIDINKLIEYYNFINLFGIIDSYPKNTDYRILNDN